MDPKSLRYTKSHEWASRSGEVVTVGITKFAADQLTDVTFIELPAVGKTVKAGDEFGNIETVKAVSPLYSPVAGSIQEVNASLEADPNRITQDPFGACWLVKIRLAPGATLDHLLDFDAYEKQCASEAH
jgi:glycine cleavage system H protein